MRDKSNRTLTACGAGCYCRPLACYSRPVTAALQLQPAPQPPPQRRSSPREHLGWTRGRLATAGRGCSGCRRQAATAHGWRRQQ